MIDLIPINYVAVLVAAVASMVVGFVWYSSAVFGNTWMKLVGKTKSDLEKGQKMMGLTYTFMFGASLVEAYVLSHFIHYAGAYSIVNGAKTGVWAWLGFVATTALANHLFAGRPRNLYLLDMGYHLVNLIIMGAIIAYMY